MGSKFVKEEPEEALEEPVAMPARAPSSAPASAPGGAEPDLIAAVEGVAAAAASPQEEAVPAAAAAAVVPAPQEQALALNNSLLQDIKSALLDVRFDMGACEFLLFSFLQASANIAACPHMCAGA